jgi:hypothetical protein
MDELDAKVNGEVDSVHVKRICIKDLVGYVYIVIEDIFHSYILHLSFPTSNCGKIIIFISTHHQVLGVLHFYYICK